MSPTLRNLQALFIAGFCATAAWAFEPHVAVVTREGAAGHLSLMSIGAPWPVAADVVPVGGDAIVRHFFGRHYVVNRDLGTIQVINPDTQNEIISFAVGASPQDIVVVGAHQAYVSRFDSALLLQVDPTSGRIDGSIDLGFLADDDGVPDMSMMALDGYHLFVQIQRLDRRKFEWTAVAPSYLAVIDVRTNELIDTNPHKPNVQPIELQGLRPAYKMFVERSARRLYVSVPAGFFDPVEGAIEEIDLDGLESLGFVTTEGQLQTLDLGAFVMVSPQKGYAVTHTELVESSHVTGFSRTKGTPVSQVYTTLFGSIRSIAHDPPTSQVFLPDPTDDGTIGMVVFDSTTDEILTPAPRDVGGPPVDVVVARLTTPGEARDLRLVTLDPATQTLGFDYEPACGAPDHNVVYGPLEDVARYGYTGRVCGIGNLGSYTGFDPGRGSFFFLVAGSDGESIEGSYGTGSESVERPWYSGGPACATAQQLLPGCQP